MTHQLKRDLEWWRTIPKLKRTLNLQTHRDPYPQADSIGVGWGTVLNENPAFQARGFWHDDDRYQHITWKERRPPAAQRRRPRRGVRSQARRHPLTSPWWALETP
jgi:riboflavin biosynthesis pyrimidine reductase